MFRDSIYSILEQPELPWWMVYAPFLTQIVENPVFQLRYKQRAPRKLPLGFLAALVGIVVAVFIFILVKFITEDKDLIIPMSASVIAGTIAIVSIMSGIRAFFLCLVYTCIEFRREIDTSRMRNLLTSPLSDEDIFFGNTYPVLFRVLAINEGLVWSAFGMLLVLMVLSITGWKPLSEQFEITVEQFVSMLIFALIIFIQFTVSITITSVAAGLYSIKFPVPSATVAVIAHLLFIDLFLWLVSMMRDFVGMGGEIRLNQFFSYKFMLVIAVLTALLIFMAWLTEKIGAMIFARYRRPGFFEPEWASASGLITLK